jgi:hypothetical protein
LPKVLFIALLVEGIGLDCFGEELGRHPPALSLACTQPFSRAENRNQRQSFDAEWWGGTPTLGPPVLQRHIQQLLRRRVIGFKLAEGQTMANLALGRLQELREAGCERMIERLAFSVLPPSDAVLLIDASTPR